MENDLLKIDEKGDVGMKSDLISFLINITSDEIHSFMSYVLSKNPYWINLGKKERELRTRYMKLLVNHGNDMVWCKSKHKLIEVMNLIEIGNRFSEDGMIPQAEQCYKDAETILNMIFEINSEEAKK